jgi:hypothetical protein
MCRSRSGRWRRCAAESAGAQGVHWHGLTPRQDYSDTEGILGPPAGYDPATGFQRHEPVADAEDDGWGDALPAKATGAEPPVANA